MLRPRSKIIMRTIPGAYIGALIGPGGKVIQELQKATGTTIVINEVNEEGIVEILEPIRLELQQYWPKSTRSSSSLPLAKLTK
jgi:predicted PilT family ATPase